MFSRSNGGLHVLELPASEAEVLPGICWGAFDRLLTPAFWAGRAWLAAQAGVSSEYRLGRSLKEEVAACLLGGYGIPAEVGLAAFQRVRASGLLDAPNEHGFAAELAIPVWVNGRPVRYRFARQKARYLAASLAALDGLRDADLADRELRDVLTGLPGIGLKTASWVTRNFRRSDEVAILDVHVCRACVCAGVFPEQPKPERDYRSLEACFLRFARALSVPAAVLDNVMWQTMRCLPSSLVKGAGGVDLVLSSASTFTPRPAGRRCAGLPSGGPSQDPTGH